jgi:hypothetical protein
VRPFLSALIVLAVLTIASAAGAAQIVQPSARPYRVPSDAHGPVAFTIVAAGFRPGAAVYVEQCDGSSPRVLNWSPADHCDNGTSPAPVYADGRGQAMFDAHDRNHKFTPFVGASPQSIFNCGTPGNCTVRVATNLASATDDQVFIALALQKPTSAAAPTPTTSKPAAGSGGATAGTGSNNAATANGGSATGTGATQTAAGSSTSGGHGPLAFTGLSAVLAGVALVLVGVGVALLSRSKR